MLGLKGVSKSVVEMQINDSAYFERAVFYIKPNLNGISSRALNSEAAHWLRVIAPQDQKAVWRVLMRYLCIMIGSGCLGACIASAVILLLQ